MRTIVKNQVLTDELDLGNKLQVVVSSGGSGSLVRLFNGVIVETVSLASGTTSYFGVYTNPCTFRITCNVGSIAIDEYQESSNVAVFSADRGYLVDPLTNRPNAGEITTTFENLIANYPAASNTGLKATLSDVNNITVRSDGTRYKPLNGSAVIRSLGAPSSTTGASYVTLVQVTFPAGMIKDNDKILITRSASRDNTTDACFSRIWLGNMGDGTDVILHSQGNEVANARRSHGSFLKFMRMSATTIQELGATTVLQPYGGLSDGAIPAVVTLDDNMDNVDTIFTFGVYVSATATTYTLHEFQMTWEV